MRRILCFTAVLLLSGFGAGAGGNGGKGQTPPAQQGTPPQIPNNPAAPSKQKPAEGRRPGYVMKVKTRLITVDVVATDSHGNVVRDLKPEELRILESHGMQQRVTRFEFIEKPESAAPAVPAGSPGPDRKDVYTNQVTADKLRAPPTVLLMDALNTVTTNQVEARRQMLRLLKTLPAGSPVAVFLMSRRLEMVQSFTSDPALLQAAVTKALSPTAAQDDVRDDLNGRSEMMLELIQLSANEIGRTGPNTPGPAPEDEPKVVAALRDFEKEEYADTMDVREEITVRTLKTMARYLSGYPGRKNLIWFSASFPISIAPDPTVGERTKAFVGMRDYAGEVQELGNALIDARVAVYPVDARGLEGLESFSIDQQGPRFERDLMTANDKRTAHEEERRTESQSTMSELADDTGGRTCKNTNDLSGCVETAIKDSSSYYELAYYPENVKWDGSFHKILVKTTRPGVHLRFRRGYFASDSEPLATAQKPRENLQRACTDLLPWTAIPLAAEFVPADQPKQLKILLTVAPTGVSFNESGETRAVDLRIAVCEYAPKGDSFQFFMRDFSQEVSDDVYRAWKSRGVPELMTLTPKTETRRLRLAVLDMQTGLVGAVDVLVRPEDLGAPAALAKPPALPANPGAEEASPAPVKNEAPAPAPSRPRLVTFRSQSGKEGTLDWNGDKVSYDGDMAADQSAPVFFQMLFSARFHCQEGKLLRNDGAAVTDPDLRLTFTSPSGQAAFVNLDGGQPEYSGGLPVDAGARTFFERVWLLSHCKSAP